MVIGDDAWWHIEPRKHAVAAKQVIFPRQVVEVPLTAINAIHQRGVTGVVDRLDQVGLRLA